MFRFTARQSESGTAFLRQAGLPEGGVGSIIVMEASRVLMRSSAVLRMFSLAWLPVLTGRGVPINPKAGFRVALYDFTARNRIRWFGRMQACRLPTPTERHRFL